MRPFAKDDAAAINKCHKQLFMVPIPDAMPANEWLDIVKANASAEHDKMVADLTNALAERRKKGQQSIKFYSTLAIAIATPATLITPSPAAAENPAPLPPVRISVERTHTGFRNPAARACAATCASP